MFSVKEEEEGVEGEGVLVNSSSLVMAEQTFKLLDGGRFITAPEPTHCYNTHWGLLLREMSWMSVDYSEERKWKVHACLQVSQAVREYWRSRWGDEKGERTTKYTAAIQSFWLGVANQIDSSLIPPYLEHITMAVPSYINKQSAVHFENEKVSINDYSCMIGRQSKGGQAKTQDVRMRYKKASYPKINEQLLLYCSSTLSESLEKLGSSRSSADTASTRTKDSSGDCSQGKISSGYSECDYDDLEDVIPSMEGEAGRLDPLSIDVTPTAPLWEDCGASPPEFKDMESYNEARGTAMEQAIHQLQSRGAFIYSTELLPPDPDLDTMNLPSLGLTEADENAFLFSLYVSSCDDLAKLISRKRRLETQSQVNNTMSTNNSYTSSAPTNDRKRVRNKEVKKGSGGHSKSNRGDVVGSTSEAKGGYDWNTYELSLLERYATLYQGTGSCGIGEYNAYPNWGLISLAITASIGMCGASRQIRTPKDCEEKWNKLKKVNSFPSLQLNDSEYKVKVYSAAPSTLLTHRLPRATEFTPLYPFPISLLEKLKSTSALNCIKPKEQVIKDDWLLFDDIRSEFKEEFTAIQNITYTAEKLLEHCGDIPSWLHKTEKIADSRLKMLSKYRDTLNRMSVLNKGEGYEEAKCVLEESSDVKGWDIYQPTIISWFVGGEVEDGYPQKSEGRTSMKEQGRMEGKLYSRGTSGNGKKMKSSIIKVLHDMCERCDEKNAVPMTNFINVRSTKMTPLHAHESDSVKAVAKLVSQFGQPMKGRSTNNPNFAEAFLSKDAKLIENIRLHPSHIAPPHSSHLKMQELATANMANAFKQEGREEYFNEKRSAMLEEDEKAGFTCRDHPNVSMQVYLAEYLQEKLKHLPPNWDPALTPKKSQSPIYIGPNRASNSPTGPTAGHPRESSTPPSPMSRYTNAGISNLPMFTYPSNMNHTYAKRPLNNPQRLPVANHAQQPHLQMYGVQGLAHRYDTQIAQPTEASNASSYQMMMHATTPGPSKQYYSYPYNNEMTPSPQVLPARSAPTAARSKRGKTALRSPARKKGGNARENENSFPVQRAAVDSFANRGYPHSHLYNANSPPVFTASHTVNGPPEMPGPVQDVALMNNSRMALSTHMGGMSSPPPPGVLAGRMDDAMRVHHPNGLGRGIRVYHGMKHPQQYVPVLYQQPSGTFSRDSDSADISMAAPHDQRGPNLHSHNTLHYDNGGATAAQMGKGNMAWGRVLNAHSNVSPTLYSTQPYGSPILSSSNPQSMLVNVFPQRLPPSMYNPNFHDFSRR